MSITAQALNFSDFPELFQNQWAGRSYSPHHTLIVADQPRPRKNRNPDRNARKILKSIKGAVDLLKREPTESNENSMNNLFQAEIKRNLDWKVGELAKASGQRAVPVHQKWECQTEHVVLVRTQIEMVEFQ
jgi:hypothetical protein